jgi:hypothetical protein
LRPWAQAGTFAGTWQTRKSSLTGKVNLTVTIVQKGDAVTGTVAFLNPDSTTQQLPIAKPEIKDNTLNFQTADHIQRCIGRLGLVRTVDEVFSGALNMNSWYRKRSERRC